MLMSFDPFREFDRLAQRIWGTVPARPAALPVDVQREGDQFVARFDLPGVAPDSVELTVDKNWLTVSATRQAKTPETAETVVSERATGTFRRRLFLGQRLDADKVEARIDNGVLTVTIPLAETAKPRRIEISTGEGTVKELADGQAA